MNRALRRVEKEIVCDRVCLGVVSASSAVIRGHLPWLNSSVRGSMTVEFLLEDLSLGR